MSVRVDLGGRRIIKKLIPAGPTERPLLSVHLLQFSATHSQTSISTNYDDHDNSSASRQIFFKQKTAYEILRSDWSSDVCSSD
eukprot:COSAG01_NODE_64923_length_275_cov_0.340909_1_plen_82_part_01